MSARNRALVIVASFTVLCAAIFGALLNIAGGIHVGDHYRLEAVVPSAVQLVKNSDVRMGGVDVGRVSAISTRGATAVVAMELDPEHAPVHRDASVRVRAKTLVGESYVDLDRGTSQTGAIEDGGVLPITQAHDAVQLDEIFSTMAPARRARVQRALHGVGGGLRGRAEAVNRTLAALGDTITAAAPLAQALDSERLALADLVDDGGQLLGALGERDRAIRQLARGGLAAADAVAVRDDALRATLRELPGALTAIRTGTARLARSGPAATAVLDDLSATLERLEPEVAALPRTSQVALRALRRLPGLAPRARRLLVALRGTAVPAIAASAPLGDVLRELRPLLDELAPHATDLGQLSAILRSAGSSQDATGALARVIALVSSSAMATLGDEQKQALEALTAAGVAQLVNARGVNAYPEPGTALTPRPASAYRRIERDARP